MTDKEQLLAAKLGIRPGPKQHERLCRRLRTLKRQQGSYARLRAFLAAEHEFPASREWLTQRIGTTPRPPAKTHQDNNDQEPTESAA